jgi:hypothetical protein
MKIAGTRSRSPNRVADRGNRAHRDRMLVLGIILALVVPSLAAVAVATLRLDQTARSLTDQSPPVVVEVAEEQLVDRYPVALNPILSAPVLVRSTLVYGMITRLPVRAGDTVSVGSVVWRVDGVDRIAVRGPSPLWRDLYLGDTGDDVATLQKLLIHLDLLGEYQSGVLDRTTFSASRELGVLLGAVTSQLEAIPAEWFVWIPQDSFEVSEVLVEVGDQVPGPGAGLIEGIQTVNYIEIQGVPSSVDRSRDFMLVVGTQSIPAKYVGGEWRAIPESETSKDEAVEMTAQNAWLVSEDARVVNAVPATSIVTTLGGRACLITVASTALVANDVKVIASKGSQTLIEPIEAVSVVVNPVDSGEAYLCGAD